MTSPFMALAIEQARAVRGTTSPNPWVGAILVRDGTVVGAGATSPPGGAHAEAVALAAAGEAARGATLYVTLEPCTAFPGKRTPPCAEALVAAGVARVVVATADPDPAVRERGLAHLRHAGMAVELGDGADDVAGLLRPYAKHRATGRPWVIAKFAASLDGRVATASGDSKWITGEPARDLAHRQRAWVDAVMAGSGTVLADDPSLTARPGGELADRQPARVILDARGRTPEGARLFAQGGPVVVATSARASADWKRGMVARGAQLIECEEDGAGLNLDQLFGVLAARGIMSVWAEGGPTLLGSLFDGGHVDEVWAFLAPIILAGEGRPAVAGAGARFVADAWRLRDVAVERAGDDILVRGLVQPPA